MGGESATLDAHHLFKIAEDVAELSRTNAGIFHNFVAQLLYLSELARPEIQLVLSLLCTVVI